MQDDSGVDGVVEGEGFGDAAGPGDGNGLDGGGLTETELGGGVVLGEIGVAGDDPAALLVAEVVGDDDFGSVRREAGTGGFAELDFEGTFIFAGVDEVGQDVKGRGNPGSVVNRFADDKVRTAVAIEVVGDNAAGVKGAGGAEEGSGIDEALFLIALVREEDVFFVAVPRDVLGVEFDEGGLEDFEDFGSVAGIAGVDVVAPEG